jgi:hypothetical protein
MIDIHLQVIDVELTPLKEQQIKSHISPLLQLVDGGTDARVDVIVRNIKRAFAGELFCIMVRITTVHQSYYAVGMEPTFMRAMSAAQHELQKTLSHTFVPDTQAIEYLRKHAHEQYFVELFAAH